MLGWSGTFFLVAATTIRALGYSHNVDLGLTFMGTLFWAAEAVRIKNKSLIAVNGYCTLIIVITFIFLRIPQMLQHQG